MREEVEGDEPGLLYSVERLHGTRESESTGDEEGALAGRGGVNILFFILFFFHSFLSLSLLLKPFTLRRGFGGEGGGGGRVGLGGTKGIG